MADIPVIDYEGSKYRTNFWEGQGRDYENRVDRLALQRFLPQKGRRIAEIGAGYGRLADMYLGYEQIVLFDYSRTLLQEAVEQWGHDERFVFVAGDIYRLPLATGVLDTLVMVRVMHHLADVAAALKQIERVLHKDSVAVVEYANKRNLKSLIRWGMGKQTWSPLTLEPIEFVELNFDFHPKWMQMNFAEAGLEIKEQIAASHFRLPLLKRIFPADLLARFDSLFFELGGNYPLSPSIFVEMNSAVSNREIASNNSNTIAELFGCPQCGSGFLDILSSDLLQCSMCRLQYAKRFGIWDFKEPVA